MVEKLRHNSPDPTRYHENVPGMPPGIMIPLSGSVEDGRPFGLDHNKPTKVIVDPGEPGGGFEVDVSDMADSIRNNSTAARSAAADPSGFYRSQSIAEASSKLAVSLDSLTLPAAGRESGPVPVMAVPVQPMPASTSFASEFDALNTDRARKSEPIDSSYVPSAEMTKMRQELAELTHQLQRHQIESNSMLRQIAATNQKELPPETELRSLDTFPREAVTQRQRAPDYRPVNKDEQPKTDISGRDFDAFFAGIKMPYLAPVTPIAPSMQVMFDLPNIGAISANYHDVIVATNCLILVYDSRYQGGYQYIPASMDDLLFRVSIPKQTKSVYTCSSLGLTFSLGCLDIILLILADTE